MTFRAIQSQLAHSLLDEAGVDVIHGHSSHHVKGIEVYKGKAILYGCGDFLTDYEGIQGYEEFRDDLVLMYFLTYRSANAQASATRDDSAANQEIQVESRDKG